MDIYCVQTLAKLIKEAFKSQNTIRELTSNTTKSNAIQMQFKSYDRVMFMDNQGDL